MCKQQALTNNRNQTVLPHYNPAAFTDHLLCNGYPCHRCHAGIRPDLHGYGQKQSCTLQTQSLVYLFYQNSFVQNNKGYGSTIVVLLLVVIMIMTVFQNIAQKKWVHYN
ncbi:MAG: hypothetical protein ACLVHE_08890 [Dialister invisus]